MSVKRAFVWPPAVYVGRFSDGTECRMSCGDYRSKSKADGYDFERGRTMVSVAIGAERVVRDVRAGVRGWRGWHPDNIDTLIREAGPALDIVAGHFDHDGKIIPDPHFLPAPATAKAKVSTLDRLIASVRKLRADDLLRLRDEIDLAFDAAE